MLAALLVKNLFLANIALALSSHRDIYRKAEEYMKKRSLTDRQSPVFGRQSTTYLTNKTKQFAVDGDNFPLIPFPIGESYAGELEIGNGNASETLFFWFFPSSNPLATDEITIWLNGGPGCSSMAGFLQENGPVLWQDGTSEPNLNPYAWTNLTNMVWVEQPIGTGLAQGTPNYTSEAGITADFMGFWKNFMDTFDLLGRKVYITGESYAGYYIPYIAEGMLRTNDTSYFNVTGCIIIDPVLGDLTMQYLEPAVPMLNKFAPIFGLNDTYVARLNELDDTCGYASFREKSLTYPPPVPLPPFPYKEGMGCELWSKIVEAVYYVNPCFNVYHILDYCPYVYHSLDPFFNNSDVQAALHVPLKKFTQCGAVDVFPGEDGDTSDPVTFPGGPLAYVIERTNNVLVANGDLDFLIGTSGSLIALQNMTWNGKQGFQSEPKDDFFVPYDLATYILGYPNAGAGFLGITHQERGLTWCTVELAGHELPQYSPGAAYRQLEFILGRISSLTQMGNFTTQSGNYTG